MTKTGKKHTELCSIEGCGRPFFGKGFCKIHYERNRRGVDLHKPIIQHERQGDKCRVKNCTNQPLSKGLCNAHYLRAKRDLPLEPPIQETKRYGCQVEECNEEHFGLGLCRTHYGKISRIAKKLQFVEEKGGECQHCHQRYHHSALDFHHLDPSKKDIAIGSEIGNVSLTQLREEIDKCILLCANCHRIHHASKDLDQYAEQLRENYSMGTRARRVVHG